MADLPALAPPGAGIPLIQRLVARYTRLPAFYRRTSWDDAQELFDKEGRKILELARSLPVGKLGQRALVDPMIGLEDSSRYWSVAMAIEHLIIVGEKTRCEIEELTLGHVSGTRLATADFKPEGTTGGQERDPARAIPDFEAFLGRFRETMARAKAGKDSRLKLRHPWFGPMTAHEWHCLAPIHQNLHRRQIQAIVEKIEAR